MITLLSRNWWALALRGVIAILLGIVAFAWPGATIAALVLLFVAYTLVDGVFAIIAGIVAAEHHQRWWPLVFEGIVDIAAAIVVFLWPGVSVLVMVWLIGAWAIVTGILLLVAAFRLRQASGEWLLILNGIISLGFGILLVLAPVAGAIVLVWWLGAYALFFGAVMLGLAFRLRRHLHSTQDSFI